MNFKCCVCQDSSETEIYYQTSVQVSRPASDQTYWDFFTNKKQVCGSCYAFFCIAITEKPKIAPCNKKERSRLLMSEAFQKFSKLNKQFNVCESYFEHKNCDLCHLQRCRAVGLKPEHINDTKQECAFLNVLAFRQSVTTPNQLVASYPDSEDVADLILNATLKQTWSFKESQATWVYFYNVGNLLGQILEEDLIITRFIGQEDMHILQKHNRILVSRFLLLRFLSSPTAIGQLEQLITLHFVLKSRQISMDDLEQLTKFLKPVAVKDFFQWVDDPDTLKSLQQLIEAFAVQRGSDVIAQYVNEHHHIPDIMFLLTTTRHIDWWWSDSERKKLQDQETIERCRQCYKGRSKVHTVFPLIVKFTDVIATYRNRPKKFQEELQGKHLVLLCGQHPKRVSKVELDMLSQFVKAWEKAIKHHVIDSSDFINEMFESAAGNGHTFRNCEIQVSSVQQSRLRESVAFYINPTTTLPKENVKKAILLYHLRFFTMPFSIGVFEMCSPAISDRLRIPFSNEYLISYFSQFHLQNWDESQMKRLHKLLDIIKDYTEYEAMFRLTLAVILLDGVPSVQATYHQFKVALYMCHWHLKKTDPEEEASRFFEAFNQLCTMLQDLM